MVEDYIKEPKDKLFRFGPEEINYIRKHVNLDKKEDREKAIDIIDEWVKSQDHFLKKDYSKGFIERCLITCNGSLERTKKQFDKMCTFRTLMPQYFEITNMRSNEFRKIFFDKGYAAVVPNLTKQHHRVIILKAKPNINFDTSDISIIFKYLIYCTEYVKTIEYCLGLHIVFDIFDASASNIVSHVNLIEIQQLIPIFTQGFGCKLKGLYIVTASKIIETFFRVLKPLFSEKIGRRMYAVTDRNLLKKFIDVNVLPADYDGPERSIEELWENFVESLSAVHIEEIIKEMKKGIVDESRRRNDKLYDVYMGIPGTFRTLSLD